MRQLAYIVVKILLKMMKNNYNLLNIMLGCGLGGLEDAGLQYGIELQNIGYNCTNIYHQKSKMHEKMNKIPNTYFISPKNKYDIFSVWKLAKMIKKFSITHVIIHGRRAKAIILLIKFFIKMPKLIFIEHSEINISGLNKMDKIGILNNQIRHNIVKTGVNNDKICNIPNFINIESNNFVQKSKKNELTIGWMHRFHEVKGMDIFFNAIKILQEKGLSFNVLIGGGNIEKVPFKLGNIDLSKIKFLGWVNDFQSFANQCDVFCVSSRAETFCLTMVNAMACGVPIVSTPTNGPLDILNKIPNSAIISDDYSVKSFANAIENFINKEDNEIELMSQNSRKIAEIYNIKNWALNIEKILR